MSCLVKIYQLQALR